MGWTKRDFIKHAFEEIGLSASVYDLTPDQQWVALAKLDAMMANWEASGVRVGWLISSMDDDTSIDQVATSTDAANEAIYQNLAIRLCPAFGKVASAELRQLANTSYRNLLCHLVGKVEERRMPAGEYLGGGYKGYFGVVTTTAPPDTLDTGNDERLELE
jgi:hypothetical protein